MSKTITSDGMTQLLAFLQARQLPDQLSIPDWAQLPSGVR